MLISGFGQVLKTFTNNNYGISDGQTGTLTYTYYEDASGNYIKHGKYSINASYEVSKYWNKEKRTHQNIRFQHTANATFKDGWLDGTVTITKKKEVEENKSKVFYVQTETVNYKDGIPHGLWKIVETIDNKTSTLISMTFTDGILTGQFHWQDQTGQFDSEGRYSGTWTERDYQTYIEHNFINGVEVSVIKRKDGTVIEKTPDEDIAIATKFANGEVLESELENKKYILKESSGLFRTNLPTKPFYWNNYDLEDIGGDKTLETKDHDKILGKPYFYLEKIKYPILSDHMFKCILVDLELLKSCNNYKPVLADYQDIYYVKQSEDALYIKGNTYYMTHEQRRALEQYESDKKLENKLAKSTESTLIDLCVISQLAVEKELGKESVTALLAKAGLSEHSLDFLPIVYFSVDSSTMDKGQTLVFCTLVKKIDDSKAPYQTWKSSFLFENSKLVKNATLIFNDAQRVSGLFEAIVEMKNTIESEKKLIMSLNRECPEFVKAYNYCLKRQSHRIVENLDSLIYVNYIKPEEMLETYKSSILPRTKCFADLARQYKTIKEEHNEILEKTKYYSNIQQSYLKAVGEKPYEMGDRKYRYNTNYQYEYDHTDYYFKELKIEDTNKLKGKYINVAATQRAYLNMLNAIDIRDKNKRKIQDDPDKACKDVISWYKKNEKNFDQSLSGSISDITKKTRALVNFQNTTLKFMEKRKYISKQNELITMNAGEFAKDVDKAYQAYAKKHDISITADTVESFKRLQQLSTIQDSCLAFIAQRKLIADNDAQIIEKGKNCKNITKAYSAYMKSADLAWTPDLNCCNKLRNVINIQKQFLTAVNSSKAAELDEKIKKLKDKSIENVLKELK